MADSVGHLPRSRYVQGPAGTLEDLRLRRMPRWMIYLAVVGVCASWVPLAIIYRARHNTSPFPRIHIFQDMDNQAKFRPQDQNAMFADGRSMRPKIAGTVARGQLHADAHLELGYTMSTGPDGKPAATFMAGYPDSIQKKLDDPKQADWLLRRGQERYNIYCAICHAPDGSGLGAVHRRADELAKNGTAGMAWVQPKNLHDADIRARPDGHIFNTITNGIRTMGGYGDRLTPEDRWAVVAYVRALQLSQAAKLDAVPENLRSSLKPKPEGK